MNAFTPEEIALLLEDDLVKQSAIFPKLANLYKAHNDVVSTLTSLGADKEMLDEYLGLSAMISKLIQEWLLNAGLVSRKMED